MSRKDASVRLSTPRFFTQGDEATIATVVSNDLDKDAAFLIELECEGGLAGGQETRTIPAGGEVRIDWPIRVERSGTVTLRAKALSEIASDAMELNLPVRPYGIEKRIVQNGVVEKGGWDTAVVVPEHSDRDSASMEIVVSSASTMAVRDALPYLAGYPYGCVEQTMSRFLPAVVAARAMKRHGIENEGLATKLPGMVHQGLQRLYGFQYEDGGWGWWKHDATDEFMTTYVVFGLLTARQAGYQISESILQRGVDVLHSHALTPFSAYVLKMANADVQFELDDIQRIKDPRHQSALTEELAYLVLAGYGDLAGTLPVDPPRNSGPSQVRATALVVRALASLDVQDKRIPRLVDWLMQQRRGGAWYSTLDTAYAVLALSTLRKGAENLPVDVTVNGVSIELISGRVSLSGSDIRPGENTVEVRQVDSEQSVHVSVLLNYFATELETPSDEESPLTISRKYERAFTVNGETQWQTIDSGTKVTIDDELRVTTIVNETDAVERVMIESPIPAGTEARVDDSNDVDWQHWFDRRELRDDRVSVGASHLSGIDNRFEYRLRPTIPGRYRVLPARVFPMYDPDQQAHSSAFVLEVVETR